MTPRSLRQLAEAAPAEGAPLSELQNWMAEILRHERALPKSEEMRKAAAKHFSGNDRLSPAEQINLYRSQFWLRHTGVLIEDFPGLTGLLGQKKWEAISQSYLSGRAYCVESLRDLGKDMSEHLAETELEHQDLLVDMAKLEWAYVEAFDATDDLPLDPKKLSAIAPRDWENARFLLSPSLSLLKLRYPVADIRRSIKKAPGEAETLLQKAEKQEMNLVVYRRNRELFDKKISRPAFLLLEQFAQGTPLISACERVVQSLPEAEATFDAELTSWFTLWGKLGWIVDVSISEDKGEKP